ncbi:MAG: RNase adapter RapZ [Christensenellales bacterium]|jgi:UPF0042 nucleotide-binding protein
MELLMVTGLSGAGKTQVIRNLEDMGFFCVDNIPPALLPGIISIISSDTSKNSAIDLSKVAVVIDIRAVDFLKELEENLTKLREMDVKIDVLFLDASDDVIIRRFKESRRKHPLEKGCTLLQAIAQEREILMPLKDMANHLIDTSRSNIKQLRGTLHKLLKEKNTIEGVMVSISSFGYKHGIPLDADLVFDVRFLPNPFYIDKLKEMSGRDLPVRDYIFSFDQTNRFLDKLEDMVTYLLPYYEQEGKDHLVISIGCTGGRHRSVAISEALYDRLKEKGNKVYIDHRDINRK